MNFRDQAIIISKKPLKERSYILTVFTAKHGIYSGVINQYSKKTGDGLSEGNLIDFFWSARLHEHIGSVKAELIKSYNSHIIMNKTKLYAFNSVIDLLKMAFCEREPHNNLFPALLNFIESFKQDFSFVKYIELELEILAESGYTLQLDRCAVTDSAEDLCYVSPKSGRAVSKNAGADYADKLLKLPKFFISNTEIDNDAINDAFRLTSYFFERYVFLNKKPPISRVVLMEHLLVRPS
jgi:DNA repair protein RecO (recombination protein O)